MQPQKSLNDLTDKDMSDIGDLVTGETMHKVNYFEEQYRILQQDPRLLEPEEQTNLIKTRDYLVTLLHQREKREHHVYTISQEYSAELSKILIANEIDNIIKNNVELWYQLRELTETVIRFDIELLCDRIIKKKPVVWNLLEIESLIQTAITTYKMSYKQTDINIIKEYIYKT